jgi:hypothetical protein
MSWIDILSALVSGFTSLTWQSAFLILLGCVLLYLAIAKGFEPLLLIPIGFGVILGNLPLAQLASGEGQTGVLNIIYQAGIMTEIFPCLIFVGLGAMIDFGPMLANPAVLIFGAAGQFGIFLTLLLALALGFARQEACSIAIIGACDGPTAIYVTSKYSRSLNCRLLLHVTGAYHPAANYAAANYQEGTRYSNGLRGKEGFQAGQDSFPHCGWLNNHADCTDGRSIDGHVDAGELPQGIGGSWPVS